MKIDEVLQLGEFKNIDCLDRELILSKVLGVSREYIFGHGDELISKDLISAYIDICKERLKGKPLAYLFNSKEFYGLDFYVDERVLIPRPDTEILIEKASQCIEVSNFKKIVEIGVGSGCISIALCKIFSEIVIKGVDISGEALEVAKKNVEKHELKSRIVLEKGDLLNKFEGEEFDLLVLNPPYVEQGKKTTVDRDVYAFEPHLALFAGEDGMDIYRRLFSQVKGEKIKVSAIIGEFGFGQRNLLEKLIESEFDACSLTFHQDLAGIDRVFVLSFNH